MTKRNERFKRDEAKFLAEQPKKRLEKRWETLRKAQRPIELTVDVSNPEKYQPPPSKWGTLVPAVGSILKRTESALDLDDVKAN